ncbi:hypothetical protein RHGRI_034768 [Rhododendron griersonianum]|uniref:X8 domain-containing protein n=1 Tax=Rhododendron griersonianum TaxID=479676 RepID=A0AAV6I218_9ERIC|nr:hypothetical protein RHGRI_034768 [Rhododendron griersonianum]
MISLGATWCICKDGESDAALQKTLDYACGAGADCTPIHQNGACYNPNTVRGHCNYAVNSYFQKKGQAQGSCDFTGTASATTSDPSEPAPSATALLVVFILQVPAFLPNKSMSSEFNEMVLLRWGGSLKLCYGVEETGEAVVVGQIGLYSYGGGAFGSSVGLWEYV